MNKSEVCVWVAKRMLDQESIHEDVMGAVQLAPGIAVQVQQLHEAERHPVLILREPEGGFLSLSLVQHDQSRPLAQLCQAPLGLSEGRHRCPFEQVWTKEVNATAAH